MDTSAPPHKPVILISGSSPDSESVAAMMVRVRAAGAEPMLITNHLNI